MLNGVKIRLIRVKEKLNHISGTPEKFKFAV